MPAPRTLRSKGCGWKVTWTTQWERPCLNSSASQLKNNTQGTLCVCWVPQRDLQETLFYNRCKEKHFSTTGLRRRDNSIPNCHLAACVVPTQPCFYTRKLNNVGSITPCPSPYPQGRLFVSQSSRFLLVWKSRQEGQKTQWLFDRLKNRQLFYLKAPRRIKTSEFYTLLCWNGVRYYPDLQAHATRPV